MFPPLLRQTAHSGETDCRDQSDKRQNSAVYQQRVQPGDPSLCYDQVGIRRSDARESSARGGEDHKASENDGTADGHGT